MEPDRKTADMVAQYMHEHKLPAGIAHAVTAQEALKSADQHKPDLVILELAMPEHNGIAFLHEFRSYPDWSGVPVIIHSHLSQETARIPDGDLQRLHIVKYLYKPTTTLAKLHAVVLEAIA